MYELLLRALAKERDEFSRNALARPQSRDAFEYGRVCGYVQGLEKIDQLIASILDDRIKEDELK